MADILPTVNLRDNLAWTAENSAREGEYGVYETRSNLTLSHPNITRTPDDGLDDVAFQVKMFNEAFLTDPDARYLPEPFKNHLHRTLTSTGTQKTFFMDSAVPTGFIHVTYNTARTQAVLVYYVLPSHRGQSKTVKALQTLIAYHRENHPSNLLLQAAVKTDNRGSIRTLEKAGFLHRDTRNQLLYYTYSVFKQKPATRTR